MRTRPHRGELIRRLLRTVGPLLVVTLIGEISLQAGSLVGLTGQAMASEEVGAPVSINAASPAWFPSLDTMAARLLAPSTPAMVSLQATEAPTHTMFLPYVSSNNRTPLTHRYGVQIFSGDAEPEPLMVEAGVNWVRLPIFWAYIEPTNTTPEQYRWSPDFEARLRRLGELHFQVILTVERNPSWAATYWNGPLDKTDPAEYAEFLNAAVARYSAPPYNVMYWEIYNEPDNGDEMYATDSGLGYFGNQPAAYAQVLATAYGAIKSANPEAQVVFGGIMYDWWTENGGVFVKSFLDGVLQYIQENPGSYFDVMNFHLYPPFESYWNQYGLGLIGKATYIRQKMASYGLDKPIICSETGTQSSAYPNGGGSDQIQARYVVQTFARGAAADLDTVIWYKLVDDPGVDGYWKTGLLDENENPRLAFYVYQTLIDQLGKSVYSRALEPGEFSSDVTEGYFFDLPQTSSHALAVWSYDGTDRELAIPAGQLAVVDQTGNQTIEYDGDDGLVDGVVHVGIGLAPVYIHFPGNTPASSQNGTPGG